MILEKISSEADIKKLNIDELSVLATEIREKILAVANTNGGHLASNLGIVELTIALHYVYDFPKDKLIFDVGHQCYTHKILTRKDKFDTIRQEGGISGFPNIFESEFDNFSTGHAGTSISAGLGYCFSRDIKNENYEVISLIGDGSIVNGLALEAITANNVKPENFLVILNDNGMSISKNNNGFYKVLAKATTKKSYDRFKSVTRKIFGNSFITRGMIKFRDFWKRALLKNTYFEQYGFKYIGLIDGNDIKEVVSTLKLIKNSDRPILLHVKTKKGKGYKDAEDNAERYHGVSKNMEQSVNDFSERFGVKLTELAKNNDKIVAITAGMKEGVGLKCFEENFPKRFLDVGISEEYAVTLASGISLAGLKPVVAIYSTFIQRAYDEILHDVCMQNLGVVFCIDRAGLVGSDGQTHQGVFDLSFLSHIPNLSIFAPKDLRELDLTLEYALSIDTPVAIRYPNGKQIDLPQTENEIVTSWEILYGEIKPSKAVILAVGGRMIKIAIEAAKLSRKKIAVINARQIKPLDKKILNEIKDKTIITIEENSEIGGFGSLVHSYYSATGIVANLRIIGVKDKFVKHGSVDNQLQANGLTAENILKALEN